MENKRCTKCGERKPLKEFHKDSAKKDGHVPVCKTCKMNNRAREKKSLLNLGFRRCGTCGEVKPLDEFKKDWRNSDGRSNVCRMCSRKASKEYRDRHKAQQYATAKRWYERNPNAHCAHQAIVRAVRNGILPPVISCRCAQCGKQAAHYHHHLGYAKENRLSVIPLCQSCHFVIHIQES